MVYAYLCRSFFAPLPAPLSRRVCLRPRLCACTWFGLSLAAIAGVFVTHYNGGIGPSEAGVMKSVRYVAIVAVGGMANIWGALIMGIVLNFLSLRGVFGSYDDAVFGVILIIIMLFAPEGILKINPWLRIKSLFALFFARNKEESIEN